jgi:hypothetical protein
MASLSQDKTWLPALHQKPVGEARGIVVAIEWRLGVYLGVQSLQLVGMLGSLRAVEQPVRKAGR